MRTSISIISLCLLLVLPTAVAQDRLEAFGYTWTVPIGDDWKVAPVDGVETLELLVPRPSTQPRRPSQFALAQTPDFSAVTVEVEVKQEPAAARQRHTSLIIVYAYQDENHFYYAHLSVDTGEQEAVHNGIFRVNGGDRERISTREGPAALTSEEWRAVRLVFDGSKGSVGVTVNGKALPALHAVDKTFRSGRVGLGSFFDMGQFRNVMITGTPVQ